MSNRIEGLSIGLDLDTVGIDNSLKQLKGKIGLVDSEMRANLSTFDKSEVSVKKYETQLTGLTKRLDVQKASVKASKEEYDKMVDRHGKSSIQAEKAATIYNKQVSTYQNLERRVGSLTEELKDFEEQQRIAASGWTKMGDKMEKDGERLSAIGGKMQGIGAGMTAGLTAPITAFGIASGKTALDFDQAQGKIQAQLGLTAEEAEKLGGVAQKVWKNNFGEDIGEATDAVAGIRQMMGDLSEEELQAVAEGAFTIRDAFGADIQETTRTASVLMKNFGIDGENALDLITTGFQRGGDFTGELLDTLREYAPQFEGMGYDAEEFTAILIAGAETGAFNLDKVGDAAKEAFVRIGDGSKASRESLGDLGLDFEQIETGINSGGDAAKSSFAAVVSAIATVEDPAARAQTAVALLGTPLEDLGPEFQTFFSDVNTDLGDFEGATGKAGVALYDNLGAQASETFRQFQEDLLPTGEILIDLAEDILPKVADSVESVTGWFAGLDEGGQKTAIMIGGVAAAGPLLLVGAQLTTGFASILSVVGPLTGAIAGAGGLTGALGAAGGSILAFATGPVGIGIAAIAALTIGGIAFAKHMSEDAIPEVDRFGDQISETTQESLGKFFELSDGVGEAMAEMSITGKEVTEEMATDIAGRFASMNEQILEGMRTRQDQQLESMTTFFANSSALSEEEAAILKRQGWHNEMEIAGQEAKEARVQEIIETALAEKRDWTETERIEINAIRASMNTEAVEQLSANEVEQAIIMQRMKDTAGALSATQAADVVKRATEQKDGAVAAAEQQYEDSIAEFVRMRDESGSITAEQAEALIADAKKTRDESVGYAESMHADVVKEAKAQAGEHVDEVDWSTGEILSKWEVYKKGVIKRFKDTNESSMADFKRWGGNISDAAGNVKDDMLGAWESYKTGINTKFQGAAQNALNRTGDLVNGVIKGINWALEKLDMKKLGFWTVPNVLGRSGAGSKSGAPVRAYAHGTGGHPGGLALLGDGKGDNAGAEYIRTPDGKHGFSPATNTLMDLPRGTTVLSAKETRALFGPIPKYANGIGGVASHLWESGKGLLSAGKEKAFDVFDYLTNPKKLLDIGLAAVGFKMPTMGGFMKDALSGGLNKVKDGAIDYLKNAFGDFGIGGSGGAGFGPAFRKTSSFGMRIHPILKTPMPHNGDDYGAPVGTPIPAQAGGRVTAAGWHDIRGNYVRIKSGALDRIYQHNQRNLVRTGDMVKQGQYIGTVGSTGRSTGPHLHYEVLRNGRNINPTGLATGGITNGFMVSSLHEEGYPEFVIPTAPNRRTDAMKLLALAYKQIGGGDKATRPNQLPNVPQGSATDALLQAVTKSNEFLMKQNEILMQLLGKDSNLYVDGDVMAGSLAPRIETINNDRNAMRDSGRHGRRY